MALAGAEKTRCPRPFHAGADRPDRDLNFFLLAFAFSAIALFVPHQQAEIRAAIGLTLVLTYFVYIMLTLRASAHLVKAAAPLAPKPQRKRCFCAVWDCRKACR